MTRARKFFHNLARVNSVLMFFVFSALFIMAVVIIYQESHRSTAKVVPQTAEATDEKTDDGKLSYQNGIIDSETGTVRLVLQRESSGDSLGSGRNSEEVNVLFVPSGQANGRWLLPDSKHVLHGNLHYINLPGHGEEPGPLVALALLVGDPANEGQSYALMLCNASGEKVIEVSKDVSDIEVADLAKGAVMIVYSKGKKLHRAMFDSKTLEKLSDDEIAVPKLK